MPVEAIFDGRIELNDDQARLVATIHGLLDEGDASLRRVEARGDFHQAIVLLTGQALATGRALHLLCVAGRSYQAFPTARALVENVVNAHYIARDPTERSARFWAYRPIPHAKVAEARFRVFGEAEQLDEIRRQAREASRLLGDKHWARANVRQRAEECGLGAIYDLYYTEASAFSHSESSTFNALISDDGRTITLGPSPAGIETVLAPAFSALYVGLLLVIHVFGDRDLEHALQQAILRFPNRIKRIDLSAHFDHLRMQR